MSLMAIILTVAPLIRPFRGFSDPALPAGYWAAKSSVLGDGSGSLQSLDIRFTPSTGGTNSLMYSLEQLMINVTRNTLPDCRLDLANFDPFPSQASTGAVTVFYAFPLVVDPANSGRLAMSPRDMTFLPLFLGATIKDANAEIGVDVDNVTATSLAVFAQGFFWTPGAINAPGGPQRPPNSVYGR